MREELLKKIDRPVVRKEIGRIMNNGYDIDNDDIAPFLVDDLKTELLQTFKDTDPKKIVDCLSFTENGRARLFIMIEADYDFYSKATEFIENLSDKVDSDISWKFLPTAQQNDLVKIIALSN